MPKVNKPNDKSSLAEHIGDIMEDSLPRESPVWRGPEVDGITYSLLSRFLVCRERFRLLVFEGLTTQDKFSKSLEYGNMWHICEEYYAKEQDSDLWVDKLKEYCRKLCERYPMDQNEIELWYHVCKMQFPEYVKYWSKHREKVKRERLCEELEFKVPYTTSSGNQVLLRGKIDSIDYVVDGNSPHLSGIWLQENKSKGTINERQITNQLRFDAQTMMYFTVVKECILRNPKAFGIKMPTGRKPKLTGVRYNCVRRPLSGGKGTIQRHKAKGGKKEETWEHYYGRIHDYISTEPWEYFFRWNVEISDQDVHRFRREFLDPILDQLCVWYGWVHSSYSDPFDYRGASEQCRGIHYRSPYGVYNTLHEGGTTQLDDYIDRGSSVGLVRIENLFPELGKESV